MILASIYHNLTGAAITVSGVDPVITFPDPNLEAAIRDAIEKPTGDIYQSDLLSMTVLDVYNRSIIDLTGLEYCVNLGDLNLYNNQISDISPLSTLTNLTVLDLSYNQINDISSLSGLTRLTEPFTITR